ncbi:MAG: endonuclease III [Planctomycetota bacterium]|nr:MAG: endonuclease III [Planctomycetota bacterium]
MRQLGLRVKGVDTVTGKRAAKKAARKKKARKNTSQLLPRRQSQAALRRRLPLQLEELQRLYPEVDCALDHETPFQLLAATILSAQCTDERVNQVTPALFARFPDPAALAAAGQEELEALVYSTGFYRNKAKNLIGMARGIVRDHGGEVPRTMEALLALPGVARKTANVVLGTAFGIAVGVVVDTHVTRLARRLGWTRQEGAVPIERDLVGLLSKDLWIWISHALIWHGRKVCEARKPLCGECTLAANCPGRELFVPTPA